MENKKYRAFVGFDGFIDRLAQVVLERTEEKMTPFPSIAAFSQRLMKVAGISADLELVVKAVRPGGNAPIMARELARLGGQVTCVGNVGTGELHPVFQEWGKYVRFLPTGEPCDALCLEFDDGKIMLPDLKLLDQMDWQWIKTHCGEDELMHQAEECTLFAFVNWSLLSHSDSIWKGFRDEFLKKGCQGRKVNIFFDLADPSKHPDSKLKGCVELISSFRSVGHVTLGLNENEARCVCRALNGEDTTLEGIAEAVYNSGVADVVLVHPRYGCQVKDRENNRFLSGVVTQKPVCSTGGGDVFNAGFCHALCMDASVDDAVHYAMQRSYLWLTGQTA